MTLNSSAKALKQKFSERQKTKRTLQDFGNELIRLSKQAIFALHRSDLKGAETLLQSAAKTASTGEQVLKKYPVLRAEGAWLAGLEEYAEAVLFERFIAGRPLLPLPLILSDVETQLGGLSDFVGELVRLAIRRATDRDGDAVKQIRQQAEDVMTVIVSLDLTGPLRSKGDQARQHMRKLEEICYDLSIRSV